ncbi:MAG: cation-translocating P-type ATPase [Oscillospiraceae bacterium]|nr:cation-translocating P-type ATPase [Oscillospiraceae bacterium]
MANLLRQEHIPVLETDAAVGLTDAEVRARQHAGLDNAPPRSAGRSVVQIVLRNLFTYFNLIFFALAAVLIAVGSWNDLLFLGVVFFNTAIGTVQELRSKQVLDRIRLLDAQQCTAVRNGAEVTLDASQLVRDDVVRFGAGQQLCADAVVLDGTCLVNEALVTGESDEIPKAAGDRLLSGSFVVTGSVTARLTDVGEASYAARLTQAAKKRGTRKTSEMVRSLRALVKWIGIFIVPFGALLLWNEYYRLGQTLEHSVVAMSAALIGLIPEGLYLLTSIALAAAVVRLARRGVLTRQLSSVETLARVDVLCVDKTGTITTGEMTVDEVVTPDGDCDAAQALRDLLAATGDGNATASALRAYFGGEARRTAVSAEPFTSVKKYSAATFEGGETWLLGAPEALLGHAYDDDPRRTVVLVRRDGQDTTLAAAIRLRDEVRPSAAETFRGFAERGVTIKVISGDSPHTVSEAARKAGIRNADRTIDVRGLTNDMLVAAAERYTVFGRVTPEQKRTLILALKAAGHTVAMTGDGVNDVLALKEADCAIAMASGSDAASRVSDLVLLDNDFSVMPAAASEGRRVVNNIQRSATLFLVKNMVSLALALGTLLFAASFPFTASRMTLIGSLTIGLPGFVLAMEPNEQRIRGHFLPNVLRRALPSALTDLLMLTGVMFVGAAAGLQSGEIGTCCTIVMGVIGLMTVVRVSMPMTPLRRALVIFLAAAFAFCVALLGRLFTLVPLDLTAWLIVAGASLLAVPVMYGLSKLIDRRYADASVYRR